MATTKEQHSLLPRVHGLVHTLRVGWPMLFFLLLAVSMRIRFTLFGVPVTVIDTSVETVTDDFDVLPPLPMRPEELRIARIEAGLCPSCGNGVPTGNNVSCDGCRDGEVQQ